MKTQFYHVLVIGLLLLNFPAIKGRGILIYKKNDRVSINTGIWPIIQAQYRADSSNAYAEAVDSICRLAGLQFSE
jgi:hypothetical protein